MSNGCLLPAGSKEEGNAFLLLMVNLPPQVRSETKIWEKTC